VAIVVDLILQNHQKGDLWLSPCPSFATQMQFKKLPHAIAQLLTTLNAMAAASEFDQRGWSTDLSR